MNYRFYLTLLVLFCAATMHAQDTEKHRTINKAFAVRPNTKIQIENKYGSIEVHNWEKDSVKFEINISVVGDKIAKVLKTFEYIDVELFESKSYISAKTVFENDKNSFWTDITDLTNSILKGGNSSEINYTVYMPKSNPLEIRNKFGNVYLDNRLAASVINISDGDLKANNFSGDLELHFSNGTAYLDKINNAYIESNYAEFSIIEVDELTLDSKSSTIRCDKIGVLNLNSKRDKLYLGELSVVKGEFSLSFVGLDYLTKELSLKTNFGDMIIGQVTNNFNLINISGRNTAISSTFKNDASFNIDLIYNKKTKLSFPTSYKNLKEAYVSKDKEESRLTATFGDDLHTRSMIKIMLSSGEVELIKK